MGLVSFLLVSGVYFFFYLNFYAENFFAEIFLLRFFNLYFLRLLNLYFSSEIFPFPTFFTIVKLLLHNLVYGKQ